MIAKLWYSFRTDIFRGCVCVCVCVRVCKCVGVSSDFIQGFSFVLFFFLSFTSNFFCVSFWFFFLLSFIFSTRGTEKLGNNSVIDVRVSVCVCVCVGGGDGGKENKKRKKSGGSEKEEADE